MLVLLAAVNARYSHKALAPWCVKAYCDAGLKDSCIQVYETSINDNLRKTAADLAARRPDAIGLSCYIWNVEHIQKLLFVLRAVLPDTFLFLGGPEVSFETDRTRFPQADVIVAGEGERAVMTLLQELQQGRRPKSEVISAHTPGNFADYPSPYTEAYFASFDTLNPIAHKLIYYESTRGCPFSCAYCLSSATQGVQVLPLNRVFAELQLLVDRGAKCIKFVDRTFNADRYRAKEILQYVKCMDTDCTFHFEVAADLFDDEMLALIADMPRARVQFEIGIQSMNQQVLREVCRVTNLETVTANIARLTAMGNCHVHVDLIAGLPGETLASFQQGFDQVLALRPHMLQLGFLKRLKGSLLDQRENDPAVFTAFAPYEVLRSDALSFDELTQLKGVEEVLDKFYNSGKYPHSIDYAIELAGGGYACFARLADFVLQSGGIQMTLQASYDLMYQFLLSMHAQPERAMHTVKLDCLTFDAKGRLPSSIPQHKNWKVQKSFIEDHKGLYQKLRAEDFPYDHMTRIFLYDFADPITREPKIVLIPMQETDQDAMQPEEVSR